MKILADATLPHLKALFTQHFKIATYGNQKALRDWLGDYDILLCRSTLKVTAALLAGTSIQCIATASSGTDHIDHDYLTQHHIPLFNAKGCNARAVADYVIATLAWLKRNKPLTGHIAGVIGVGEVGRRVVERLKAVGFMVMGFDPPKAEQYSQDQYVTMSELIHCDLLCIHANLHETHPYPTKNLINSHFLTRLKPNVTIINASRGGIVDEEALLATEKPITYCTDVFAEEPAIDVRIVHFATLCTPHIAGHSIEAKLAAVTQISQQLHQYYQLPIPAITEPQTAPAMISPKDCWQDCILSLYNPDKETQRLKTATNKKQAFLSQRQAHQNRHDFNCYDTSQLNQAIKSLLGI